MRASSSCKSLHHAPSNLTRLTSALLDPVALSIPTPEANEQINLLSTKCVPHHIHDDAANFNRSSAEDEAFLSSELYLFFHFMRKSFVTVPLGYLLCPNLNCDDN